MVKRFSVVAVVGALLLACSGSDDSADGSLTSDGSTAQGGASATASGGGGTAAVAAGGQSTSTSGGLSSGGSSADEMPATGGVKNGDGGKNEGHRDGTGGSSNASGETGRMVGMTAAHNSVRGQQGVATPPLKWSSTLAKFAQDWADTLAEDCAPAKHRPRSGPDKQKYGENIAAFASSESLHMRPTDAVNGWAAEENCWVYGEFMTTDTCDEQLCAEKYNTSGCGHYTQIVWENTAQVGCGVSSCTADDRYVEYWVCNYDPPGNVRGQLPY